jgi:hypothetical protein
MAATAVHRGIAVVASLLIAVTWPLCLASRAAGAPTEAQLSQEEEQLKAAELGLSQPQLEFLVRTLNAALLAGGIHPTQLSQAERQQISVVSGLSLQQVNDALDTYEAVLSKDNPVQVPVSQPIALVFIAAALIFVPSVFSSIGGTLFGDQAGEIGEIEGVEKFGK